MECLIILLAAMGILTVIKQIGATHPEKSYPPIREFKQLDDLRLPYHETVEAPAID
jgi:hypothetical protein